VETSEQGISADEPDPERPKLRKKPAERKREYTGRRPDAGRPTRRRTPRGRTR